VKRKTYGRNVKKGSGSKGDKEQCIKRYLTAEFNNFQGQWLLFSCIGYNFTHVGRLLAHHASLFGHLSLHDLFGRLPLSIVIYYARPNSLGVSLVKNDTKPECSDLWTLL
jgi:hypothetical protein